MEILIHNFFVMFFGSSLGLSIFFFCLAFELSVVIWFNYNENAFPDCQLPESAKTEKQNRKSSMAGIWYFTFVTCCNEKM